MATAQIEHNREEAKIYEGEAVCKQISHLIMDEIFLPRELLPLDNIVEIGHNRTTGFVWLKQKRKKEHRFESIDRIVSYDREVTAFVEEYRMSRVTGVKTKELFIWVNISEIFVYEEQRHAKKIYFANSSGISRSFPLSAFSLQQDHQQQQKNNNNDNNNNNMNMLLEN